MLTMRDTGNNARTIAALTMRDTGNVVRQLKQLWMRDVNNVPRLIFSSTGASGYTIAPDYVVGFGNSKAHIAVTTGAVTVSGAPAGATYVWNIDASGGTMQAVSPTSATTQFRGIGLGPGDNVTASITCTVTVGGISSTTGAIDASASNINGGP